MGERKADEGEWGGCGGEEGPHTAASVSLLPGPPAPPGQREKPWLLPLPGFPLPPPGIDFLHHSFVGLGGCD